VIESSAGRRALVATVLASALVAVLSVSIGGLLAWYVHSARRAWVRTILWLALLVPFFVGLVPKNYAMVLLLADNGPINDLLVMLGLGPVSMLYTTPAVIAGIVYTLVPFAALCLYGVFVTIDKSLIDAARGMGASRTRVMLTVTLPLAMPGVVAGLALVFATSLGFYVTPILLGGAEAPFMATLIGEYVLAQFDYPLASAASVMLLVTALLVLGATLLAIGRERLLRVVG
jgi:ABC-type spermidine/putrescine transport system permease subunit I